MVALTWRAGVGLAAVLALALAGCQTPGDFCDVARPLRPSVADAAAVSDGLAAQIVAHNEKGAAACGWKP